MIKGLKEVLAQLEASKAESTMERVASETFRCRICGDEYGTGARAGLTWPKCHKGCQPPLPESPDGGKDADSYKNLPPRGNA